MKSDKMATNTFKVIILLFVVLLRQIFIQENYSQISPDGSLLLDSITIENLRKIEINNTYFESKKILPFEEITKINGIAITGYVHLNSMKSYVRVILEDFNNNEHLIYEISPVMTFNQDVYFENESFETTLLDNKHPSLLKIEIVDAILTVQEVQTYETELTEDYLKFKETKYKVDRDKHLRKINLIRETIRQRGQIWAAGETNISNLSYAQKKKIFGENYNTYGLEYYIDGFFECPKIPKTYDEIESSRLKD